MEPSLTGQAQGKEKTCKKRSQRAGGHAWALSLSLSLFSSHLLGRLALMP